ncbi:MAG: Icc protein [Verrucomicrobiales bacterium]|jgi:Icc protein
MRLSPDPMETHDTTRIALISDAHISADRLGEVRGQNMAQNLERVVQQLLAESPDAVIATGDESYRDGQPGDYEVFESILAPVRSAGILVHLMVGNHDNPANMRSPIQEATTVEIGGLRCILTNTQINIETSPGRFGELQLQQIEALANEQPDRPAIVIGHHQPELPRTDFAPDIGLQDTPEFLDLLDRLPNLKAYVHGHTHSWSQAQTPGGKPIVNLPAAGFGFRFAPDRPMGWALATISDQQLLVELKALDPSHPEHGQRVAIEL